MFNEGLGESFVEVYRGARQKDKGGMKKKVKNNEIREERMCLCAPLSAGPCSLGMGNVQPPGAQGCVQGHIPPPP